MRPQLWRSFAPATAFMGFSLDNSKSTSWHINQKPISMATLQNRQHCTHYQQPIYFIREQPFELIRVKNSFALIIADTGIPSSTRDVVNDVRCQWQQNPTRFDTLFHLRCRPLQSGSVPHQRWQYPAFRRLNVPEPYRFTGNDRFQCYVGSSADTALQAGALEQNCLGVDGVGT